MFKKSVFFVVICTLVVQANQKCYESKNGKICYESYTNTANLKKPVPGEKYFTSPDGYIYKFTDEIIVSLKYDGAILYILENFDVEFVDQKNPTSIVLRVKDKLLSKLSDFKDEHLEVTASIDDVLSMLTTLNDLDAVRYAKPYMKRKYKKDYKRASMPKSSNETVNMQVGPSIDSGGGAGARASSISGAFK